MIQRWAGVSLTYALAPLSGGQLAPDTARSVVLTHSAWQRLFGGDRNVVGREVRIPA